jgi:hypothetical protein
MSLSGRWSFFSKGAKAEERECKEEQEEHNDNGEEFVFSASEKEMVNVKDNDDSGEQKQEEVKTVVESSCNTETESTDILFEKAYECYIRADTNRSATNRADTNRAATNDINESNSHYKGAHTEVMPTMPVLFIEEFFPEYYNFSSKKSVSVSDWRVYVYYDSHRGVYVVNGTRRRSNEELSRRYPDIRMTFKSRSSLAFYLRRSMCSLKHKLNVTMYSMYRSVIHLSTCGAIPSFHSIHHCRNKFRTELFGYDDCRVSIKTFKSYLNVLKDGTDDGFLFRPTNYVRI